MPDIFGRNENDYAMFRSYAAEGQADAYRATRAQEAVAAGRQPHDFNAMIPGVASENAVPFVAGSRATNDAGLGYVTHNFDAVIAMAVDVAYLMDRLAMMIPMADVGGVPIGAEDYSYKILDRTGRAAYVDDDGDRIGQVRVKQSKQGKPIHHTGAEAFWNFRELSCGNDEWHSTWIPKPLIPLCKPTFSQWKKWRLRAHKGKKVLSTR